MDKIYQKMQEFGVPTNLLGFEQMHAALEVMIESDERPRFGEVYNLIAEKMNVKPMQVERNIRIAIEKTLESGNRAVINRVFGYAIKDNKICNSQWLSKIALDLKQNLADGQKSHMICVEGYKAFTGTIKINPVGKQSFLVTGDWLYKPDTHCWYGGGSSYHESYCEVL